MGLTHPKNDFLMECEYGKLWCSIFSTFLMPMAIFRSKGAGERPLATPLSRQGLYIQQISSPSLAPGAIISRLLLLSENQNPHVFFHILDSLETTGSFVSSGPGQVRLEKGWARLLKGRDRLRHGGERLNQVRQFFFARRSMAAVIPKFISVWVYGFFGQAFGVGPAEFRIGQASLRPRRTRLPKGIVPIKIAGSAIAALFFPRPLALKEVQPQLVLPSTRAYHKTRELAGNKSRGMMFVKEKYVKFG